MQFPLFYRKLLMTLLLCAGATQSFLVLTDDKGKVNPPLSFAAQQGQQLWHAHNCQSCHQIYGFGGFLGPDLTNRGKALSDARLAEILTVGNNKMPAFDFSPQKISYLKAFFTALDASGQSQPRFDAIASQSVLEEKINTLRQQIPMSVQQQHGWKLIQTRQCLSCHSPTAQKLGPDIRSLATRLSPAEIKNVLTNGRRGMPKFTWQHPSDQDAVIATLEWLTHAVSKTRAQTRFATVLKSLPWFEYQ